jgi:hypothetical protein
MHVNKNSVLDLEKDSCCTHCFSWSMISNEVLISAGKVGKLITAIGNK